jgi:hypothetical protein
MCGALWSALFSASSPHRRGDHMTANALGSPVSGSQPQSRAVSGALLAGTNGRISAVAWAPRGDLDHREWVLEGRRIGIMLRGSPWWIGDWLLYGSTRWGERYAEASRVTGYDPKSLRNMRYVSSRFELSLRRDNLTWSHHALVAGLDRDAQSYWLERASTDRLSVEDLRLELRAERRYASSVGELSSQGAQEHTKVLFCPSCGDPVPIPASFVR